MWKFTSKPRPLPCAPPRPSPPMCREEAWRTAWVEADNDGRNLDAVVAWLDSMGQRHDLFSLDEWRGAIDSQHAQHSEIRGRCLAFLARPPVPEMPKRRLLTCDELVRFSGGGSWQNSLNFAEAMYRRGLASMDTLEHVHRRAMIAPR